MPKYRPRGHCKVCGKHRDEVGSLSARGKCVGCGHARMIENLIGMVTHEGEWHEHWRRRSLARLGIILRDPKE